MSESSCSENELAYKYKKKHGGQMVTVLF